MGSERRIGAVLAIVSLAIDGCAHSTPRNDARFTDDGAESSAAEVPHVDTGPRENQESDAAVQPEHPPVDSPPERLDADALAQHLFAQLSEFARTSEPGALETVPFTQTVALGLGPRIMLQLPREELERPGQWQIDVELHRAYAGPFSALDLLARDVDTTTIVGEHPHCASSPVPPPDGYAEMIRVSLQPDADNIDTCLMWWTVDAFVTAEGMVAAITMDLWEP